MFVLSFGYCRVFEFSVVYDENRGCGSGHGAGAVLETVGKLWKRDGFWEGGALYGLQLTFCRFAKAGQFKERLNAANRTFRLTKASSDHMGPTIANLLVTSSVSLWRVS
jgi:hypothetical protein